MRWRLNDLIAASVVAPMLISLASTFAQRTRAAGESAQDRDVSTFTVLLQGVRIGSEVITVARTGDGWLISSTGRQGAPIDLVTNRFELRYSSDWQPQQLAIEATLRGQPLTLSTMFRPGSTAGSASAASELVQGDQKRATSHQLSAGAVVMPNNFFAAYEALAARLAAASAGARLPLYVAPYAEVNATVDRVTPVRVLTPKGTVELRQFTLTIQNPSGPLIEEIWVDKNNRLARLVIPAASLALVRDDLSSVMAREERIRNPGDQDAFIPASGFHLAATFTKPSAPAKSLPAIVLVGAAGPQDRDESAFGVPIFGQLAGSLAAQGYLVVRYDKRGLGQSGGVLDTATVSSYAEDVAQIVKWLRKRRDVDGDRVAILGHGEGGAVALLAAELERKIRAVGLLAAPGQTGRDVTIWQQERLLASSSDSPAERQAKIALQLRVMDAAITGTGWEAIPWEIRSQADTPWFRSWLLFDPAAAMAKVRQPILVVHGSLDSEIPVAHADRLEQLSRSRKKAPASYTRKVILPGVNHLLVTASTGEVDEYPRLASETISPEVTSAITAWLKDAMPSKK